jgi:hypothetical protein
VTLPFGPPIEPMLAKLTRELPETGAHQFEPKWDGFRALIFRDGESVHIQSREKRPLERYFPELIAPLKAALPEAAIVDGEIVIATPSGLDFSALQLRLHPAASRVRKLSVETPASFVAFDVLAEGSDDLRAESTEARRARLESMLAGARPPVYLTPVTRDRTTAADWFERFEGAGLDGVIAKPLEAPYSPGKRTLLKIKHRRTAECVVAGFRWHKNGPGTLVGSLLLGIYDAEGVLHHIGRDLDVQDGRAQEAPRRARAAARRRARRPPVVELGLGDQRRVGAQAGHDEPLESGQGPFVGAGAPRASLRGRLRPPSGRPVPARHDLRALASGPERRRPAGSSSSRRRPPTSSHASSGSEVLQAILTKLALAPAYRLLKARFPPGQVWDACGGKLRPMMGRR